MRLLNSTTRQLESFQEGGRPQYAILSHTWETEEVSFQDIQTPAASSMAGYKKIVFACDEAKARGWGYAWVDTCCIDKSSSAELSEAINSMFAWYKNAKECYAYLADVADDADILDPNSAFAKSRWFTRGWTLQELLAPESVEFFSRDWRRFGNKREKLLRNSLHHITGIEPRFLKQNLNIWGTSIAKKMSWASRRETTRTEDLAYCLLGLFDINMPLIYGEGNKAFRRLQEEIVGRSDDQSIFAWAFSDQKGGAENLANLPWKMFNSPIRNELFAYKPVAFWNSGKLVPDEITDHDSTYSKTNVGLRMRLPVIRKSCNNEMVDLAVLSCRHEEDPMSLVAIAITSAPYGNFEESYPLLVGGDHSLIVHRDEVSREDTRDLRFLFNVPIYTGKPRVSPIPWLIIVRNILKRKKTALRIWKVEPEVVWDHKSRILAKEDYDERHILIRLWHSEGEGYAIFLYSHPHLATSFTALEYIVLEETVSRPIDYNSLRWQDNLSINENSWVYEKPQLPPGLKQCTDIRIRIGTPRAMQLKDKDKSKWRLELVRPLDIEFADSEPMDISNNHQFNGEGRGNKRRLI